MARCMYYYQKFEEDPPVDPVTVSVTPPASIPPSLNQPSNQTSSVIPQISYFIEDSDDSIELNVISDTEDHTPECNSNLSIIPFEQETPLDLSIRRCHREENKEISNSYNTNKEIDPDFEFHRIILYSGMRPLDLRMKKNRK